MDEGKGLSLPFLKKGVKNMAMDFAMRDLYPAMGIAETSTEVIPDADDMDALNENTQDAEKASHTFARGKFILLGVGVMVAVIVFLGGGK